MFAVAALDRGLSTRFLLVAALVIGLLVGVLSASLGSAAAQDMAPAHYVVQAGGGGPANIDLLQFAPQNLKVHRGDTVSWAINGFHTVHVGTVQWPDLVVMTDVDGTMTPAVNPAIAFGNTQSGATYQGGEATSGLFLDPSVPPLFSLTMDVDTGSYSYLCDVHPGMIGYVEVVGNDEAIPDPSEVSLQAAGEFGATVGGLMAQFGELEASATSSDAMMTGFTVGSPGIGRGTINQYFPTAITVHAGDSVTWTIPETSIEPHTISWPPARGQDVVPIEQAGGPPILSLGPTIAPMTESGAEIGADGVFSSGLLDPGSVFTLTFTEPGVYNFTCNIHPGMAGVVVVQ